MSGRLSGRPTAAAPPASSRPVGTADPFGWKALRGAMGSTFRLPIASASRSHRHRAAQAARPDDRRGRSSGWHAAPASAPAAPDRGLARRRRPRLADEVVATADDAVTIPMRAPVESLNVAVMAALDPLRGCTAETRCHPELLSQRRSALMSLFDEPESPALAASTPLAERMRPRTLDEFVGQEALLGRGRPLRQRDRDTIACNPSSSGARRAPARPRWRG